MNWDDLRIFLAVARGGGLLAAARRLGLDHSTVARRLSSLEAALGVQLVVRSPRGAALRILLYLFSRDDAVKLLRDAG